MEISIPRMDGKHMYKNESPCKSRNANMFRSYIHTVRTETNTDIKSARNLSKQPGNLIKYLQIFSSVMTKLKDNANCGNCFNSCKPETFAGRLTTINLCRRDAGNGSQEEIRMPAHPPCNFINTRRSLPATIKDHTPSILFHAVNFALYLASQAGQDNPSRSAQSTPRARETFDTL